ncbi:MAG TPA: DUF885 domain-containing protein [Bryobacteraceae bacterium]|jgi:uncharacterized protein (DUF885 family)|nr:DUF885 domain-containing protein [Bryobacteraceae bacterium]
MGRIFLIFALATVCLAQNRDAEFSRLADRYFDELVFRFDPVQATYTGFHQYDALLPTGSRTEIDSEIAALKKWEIDLRNFDARGLSGGAAADRELVLAQIEGQLLALDSIRAWEKNPDIYSSGITTAIYTIMSRDFAPSPERLKSVIARERLAPRVFVSARENLKNPPRVYTEIALEQLPGIVSFFQKDVPLAFQSVTDSRLAGEFKKTNQGVIDALNSYQAWLKTDLLPRSNGDFRIGAENYRKKLAYDEMVDIPRDRLLEIGFENLRHNQAEFRRVAGQIDPKRLPQQILDELEHEHPTGDHLLQAFRDVLGGLRSFIETHHIVTIPSPVLPTLQETPPFMRALTTASMDTPGAYEKVAKEAYFNVTLPDSHWTPKQVEEYLEDFNRGTIISTATHEAFPGHYVQFLWLQSLSSRVRKLVACGSNSEGWAHYSEQMMLDEGYGNGDLKLRLGQLQDALLRNARYIAGIQMHTGKMTVDQAADFFVKEGYQTRPIAEKEAKRGTSDPTYLVYTLGKLEILKLRDDYKNVKGQHYTLGEFHNAFLKQGAAPIKIVRRALLGNDSPVL